MFLDTHIFRRLFLLCLYFCQFKNDVLTDYTKKIQQVLTELLEFVQTMKKLLIFIGILCSALSNV